MEVNNANNIPTQTPVPVQVMPKQDPNGLSLTALILGICALVFICCGGGIVLGALGIIFALLSRGAGMMNSQAKVGLGLSIGALALSMIIVPIMLATYAATLFSSSDFKEQFDRALERSYNETYNEIYKDYDDAFDQYENKYDDLFEQLEDLEGKLGDT
jgi:Predicted glutathione S-transferase